MGIMEALDNITDELNRVADKLTTGYEQYKETGDLSSLGNINLNNSTDNISISNRQYNRDERMLETDTSKFSTSEEYTGYIGKWIANTGLFSDIQIENFVRASLVSKEQTSNYIIVGILSVAELRDTLERIRQSIVNGEQREIVVMSYNNYIGEQLKDISMLGVQLVGIDEILEINHAIELGLRNLPYVAFNRILFVNKLAYELNKKYKCKVDCGHFDYTNQGMSNNNIDTSKSSSVSLKKENK